MALAIHSVIQATLTYVLVAEWRNWILPLTILISHFIIDFCKVQSHKKGLIPLLADQLAHYGVMVLLWWVIFVRGGSVCEISDNLTFNSWLILTSYIAVLTPTSILIKSFIEYEKWLPNNASAIGLPNAGKWIGYLERVLILTFIYTGNIEGVGFLLAAKSVFRFGELNRAKDIKITEYVLIGTLLSFTVALILGFGVKYLGIF